MRHLKEDAGAVTCARIGSNSAAVREIHQELERFLDDVARANAVDVGNKADATRVVLVSGVVQALLFRHHNPWSAAPVEVRQEKRASSFWERPSRDPTSLSSASSPARALSRPRDNNRVDKEDSISAGGVMHNYAEVSLIPALGQESTAKEQGIGFRVVGLRCPVTQPTPGAQHPSPETLFFFRQMGTAHASFNSRHIREG